MIHFFLTFSKSAADSPFGRRLVELGVAHRIIAGEVHHRYRHRLWMVFVGRPQTAMFALRAAFQSLWTSPAPRVVVVWTHIEVLILALVRWLLNRRDTKIVLVGFILTTRTGRLHNWLRDRYFRTVFSLVDLTVVHSRVEADRYAAAYSDCRSRFVFIPWGSHIDRAAILASASAALGASGPDVLCAGRSGRDYPTLYRALAQTDCKVSIVCDRNEALQDCPPADNISVLQHCYGTDYLNLVSAARCIVIPLEVGDISAGQMVLLQAMELGKAIIITRTQTTVDYATHERDALLVEPGDAVGLRAAVQRLLNDPVLCRRLEQGALATFKEKFTIPSYVKTMVDAIGEIDPLAGQGAQV